MLLAFTIFVFRLFSLLPMHIAVLSDPANFHTQKWAMALQAEGVKVTVFSFSPYQHPDFPCVQVKPRFALGERLTYASYLRSGDRLRAALQAHAVDLVNPLNVTPNGVWAAKAGYRPIIATAMGADILEYPPARGADAIPPARTWGSEQLETGPLGTLAYGLRWRLYRQQVARALQAADLITGDNLQLVQAIRQWFGVPDRQVLLNRWGVEPALFAPLPAVQEALRARFDLRPWQRLVLAPRGLRPVYQGDLAFRAFELLVRRGTRDTKFVMLSAGYQAPPALVAEAEALSQQFQNFHFERDLLSRAEMGQLWSLVDLVLSIPVYDGYSNSLSEGRFAGAVPLVNDIPAHREIMEEGIHGLFIAQDTLTPERLADQLLQTLPQLDTLKARMAPANARWIRRHAWLPHNIRLFVRQARQLIKAHRPPQASRRRN